MKKVIEGDKFNYLNRAARQVILTALCIIIFSGFMPGGWTGPTVAEAVNYFSRAGGGNWNVAATWSTAACNGAAAAGTPAAADSVEICAGDTVTLVAGSGITNVTIDPTGVLAGSTFLLTASGNYTNNGTHSGSGGVTLSGAAMTIDGTGSVTNTGTFSISGTKTITATANLTFSGAVTATAAVTNSGTISVAGTLTINGVTFTNNGTVTLTNTVGARLSGTGGFTQGANSTLNNAGASININTFDASTNNPNTVNYTAAAQTVRAVTYRNLTLSGSGNPVTTTGVTVNGILSIEGTVTTLSAAITYGAAATLQYNRLAGNPFTATTNEWPLTFNGTGGVIIAGAGTITLATNTRTLGLSAPLTINSGATLITNGFGLTFGGNYVNNGGTLTASNSPIVITNTMASQSIAGFTTTGLVSMTKTGGTATFTGNVNGAGLTINGTGGTLNLGTGLTHTFTGDVTLTAGTLNGGSSTLNENSTSATAWNGTGTNFTAGTGTVVFGGAAQTLATASTFNNLTFATSGVKTLTGVPTVNGILSMEGTATVSAAPTYGSAATLRYNTATARSAGVEWITPFAATGGVIIANTGTITMNAAKVFNNSVPLTINSGATLSTNNFQLTFGGNFVNNGTFTAGSSPIVIDNTMATQSISGFTTTGAVSMTKTSGTATFTGNVSGGALTINGIGGTLNLGTGLLHSVTSVALTNGTLEGGSSILTVTGNWTKISGTFTCNTSKVVFNGSGPQSISGANTWYRLSIVGTVARTVSFQSAVRQTVTNQLTLTGAAGQFLTLEPITAATAWELSAPANQTVSYVSPSYSDASSGTQVDASDGTNRDGNPPTPPAGTNTNWLFTTVGAGVLNVQIVNGYNLVVDSNITAPSTYGPKAAYIGAKICNTGTAALKNVFANLGNYDAGRSFAATTTSGSRTVTSAGLFLASDAGLRISGAGIPAGSTITGFTNTNTVTISAPATAGGGTTVTLSAAAGIFPVKTFGADALRPHLAGTGDYSLSIEAGSTGIADGTRYIGTLAAGECRMQYWLFSYPQCVNVGGLPQAPPCDVSIAGSIKPTDDLTLDYDVWATTSSSIAAPTVSATRSFTLRNEISAAANKIWPNTTAKVPDEYLSAIQSVIGWGTLGPDGQPLSPSTAVYPGQKLITTQGIWYDLGNVGQGFDNNGDLIPDQNAWLQPIGDPGSFDAGCFRMVNVYGIVIVKLKTGGELLIPFENQLYHENLPDNTGVVGLVYYQFIATDGACTASMTPYQEAASGFDNEKFSSDYGLGLGLESRSFGSALTFSKTDGVTAVSSGNTLTYTITAGSRSFSGSTSNGSTTVTSTGSFLSTDVGANISGTGIPAGATITAYTNPSTVTISAAATASGSTTLTVYVGVNIGAPDFGSPLVIRETVPTGTTFVAGSAATYANMEPSGTGSYIQGYTDTDGNLDTCTINYDITSSSYRILYSNNNGITWSATEPAGVTDIQWMLLTTIALDGSHNGTDCVAPNWTYDNGTIQTSLPAGKTATLKFQVTVNSLAPLPGPVICNTALAGIGGSTADKTAVDCDIVTGVNSLSGAVFKDDGTSGGTFGNGTKDGGETGIGPGVIVSLYYDANGNGIVDSGDLLYGSTTTALTTGLYSFSNLPDGPFLVVLKKYDGATSDGINNAATDSFFNTTGWGNTTYDPKLSLATEGDAAPWPLKLNEDLTTATLAVNLDLSKNTGAVSAVNVDFGFAPPLELTKTTPVATVDEGDLFNFTITLQNRLPSSGRQGPTGCEYTVWAPTGTTAEPAGNRFDNESNAWNSAGPDFKTASTIVETSGHDYIRGSEFVLPDQKGLITKVEAVYFGWFSSTPTNDDLTLEAMYGGSALTGSPNVLATSYITSYSHPPADSDPNNGILWDITAGRTWSWTDDFTLVDFSIQPSKTGAADGRMFYMDAIGLRITTDQPCESGTSTTLSPVPLQDEFDANSFTYISANPTPTSISGSTIQWNDVGPIAPGTTKSVIITFRANDVSGLRTGTCAGVPQASPPTVPLDSSCNFARTDYGSNNVYYADGRKANDDSDTEPVNIQGKGELRGIVWNDTDNSGWPIGAESGLPNVVITLYACVNTASPTGALITSTPNKVCTDASVGGAWRILSTTSTDSSGAYQFLGLDTGYYLIEVGDTDGAPETGNTSPFGKTQTAEPGGSTLATSQSLSGAATPYAATGVNGLCQVYGGCNNTWGNPSADLSTLNLLNSPGSEEEVTTINFGYYSVNGGIYGNIWNDVDGDATYPRELGEGNLAGFTVTLSGTSSGTTTTDANGNYSFGSLGAGSYTITVTPPTLLNQVWSETYETTGGTTNLNNAISVTLSAGQISGSHDFGYTLRTTSDIGDTVYYDLDANGVQNCCNASGQPTEAGIPNVTVWLYNDVDRDGFIDPGVDSLLATAVTDASGKYLFQNYPAGSYIVKIDTSTLPAGVTVTGDPDINAATIGDLIYLDANADAAPSRTVSCTTNGTTNVTSLALFSANDVGSFITGTGIPEGTRITVYNNPSSVTISAAATSSGTNTMTLSDNGIPGVIIRLYSDLDQDGTLDSGEPIVASTITNVDGKYLFTGLNAGKYFVDIDETTLPSGLALTTSDPQTTVVTLTGNSLANSDLTKDAGYSPSSNYAIGNRVWHDNDNDGRQDPGELGIGGVDLTITTTTVGDACHTSTPCLVTTDKDGFWIKTGLVTTRTYSVALDDTDLPMGFTASSGTSDPQSVVIGTADNMGVDFGYYYTGAGSTPTGSITGRAFEDKDNDLVYDAGEELPGTTFINLLDENNNIVASTTAAAVGTYSFTGVFIGDYTVQAVNALGTRYSVLFMSAGSSFPNLNVIYDEDDETMPDNQSSVSIDGVYDNLMQDFGYQRFMGSIGDTLYQDVNENATQDLGEPGLGNVTVRLYRADWVDTNSDGYFQSGESLREVLVATTFTTTDNPLTAEDEGGKYLFSNLDTPTAQRTVVSSTTNGSTTVTSAGLFLPTDVGTSISGTGIPVGATITAYTDSSHVTISAAAIADSSTTHTVSGWDYLVKVDTTTLPVTSTLVADPDSDGTPCSDPGVPAGVCDSQQLVRGFAAGNNYLGADFGYRVTGSGNATIGDHLWIDADGDGVLDSGELGIPRITVWLDTDNDNVLDWSDGNGNGRWDSGEGERWVVTDSDGYYVFTNIADGTYNLRVLTTDPDWPASLSTTPTYEARLTNTNLNNYVQVVVTSGAVSSIIDGDPGTTDACTGCNLDSDFGYRYLGTNTLSGTICIEGTTKDGYCGATATTYSGVAADESPLEGVQVGLYLWTDDGDSSAWNGSGVLDAGDTFTLLGTTSTNLSGNYSFSNVPNNVIVVFGISETQNLDLTTTNANTSQEGATTRGLYEGTTTYQGNTVTVIGRQALSGPPAWTFTGGTTIGSTTVTSTGKFLPSDVGTSISGTGIPVGAKITAYTDANTVTISLAATANGPNTLTLSLFRDLDFAFDGSLGGTITKDFGDLPDSGAVDYQSTLLASGGAQHKVASRDVASGTGTTTGSRTVSSAGLFKITDVGMQISGTGIPAGATITAFNNPSSITISADATATGSPTLTIYSLYLGSGVSSEGNGFDSTDASLDTLDDGISLVSPNWEFGTDGASVNVTASAAGWLSGWVDFNNDGDFNDAYEQIINQAVPAGASTIGFLVPSFTDPVFFSRFRLYPAQPLFVSSTGVAMDSTFTATAGEVEDYKWTVNIATLITLSDFSAYEEAGKLRVEWTTSSEINTAGFFLLRLDSATGRYKQLNSQLLPALLDGHQGGTYSLLDRGASLERDNIYVLVEIEGRGRRNAYGPFTVRAGGNNALENHYTSGVQAAGTFLRTADKSARPHSRKVTRYVDKDGTLIIKGGSASKGTHDSPAEEISDYRRTVKAVTADRERRLHLRQEAKAEGHLLKPQRQGSRLKLAIEKDGLYYISASELSVLTGLSQNTVKSLIRTAMFALTNQGGEVAYLPTEDYSGIYFYGQGTDSMYTKENIYWLSKGRGSRMRSIADAGPDPVSDLTFTDTLHEEKDITMRTDAFLDPESDFWFWEFIAGGIPGFDTKTFIVETKGASGAPATATLTADLQGFTDMPADPDHHLQVSVNGTVIAPVTGSDIWNGTEQRSAVFEFSQLLLNNGPNTIEFKGIPTAAPWSLFFINSFDLTYQRLYEAVDNSLLLRGQTNPVVTVQGFTEPDIMVFDVTNPLKPVISTAITIEPYDGMYRASFVPASPESLYLAITPGAAAEVIEVWADSPSQLKNRNNKADYILIAPQELLAGAHRLADYRQRRGMKTMVVNVEDIMDEFNHGLSSPWAIRDFLSYAHAKWSRAPKYVLLVGDGTYDYRDNLQFGENLVPTVVVRTPDGLFTSDNILADVNNDHLPELAIGRLAVLSPEELRDQTDKIMAYERNINNRILMMADNADEGGNFPSDSDDLADIIPSRYITNKIYLSQYNVSDARQLLFSEINRGTGLINYIGHATSDHMAGEFLLRAGDVEDLSNKPFVLSVMACLTGQYAFPGSDSLSEMLLLRKNGGASAVWAPSGLAFNSDSILLYEYFLKTALKKKGALLGSAILESFRNFHKQGGPSYVLDIYTLQGDPTMKLW